MSSLHPPRSCEGPCIELCEARETLRALREGEIDALVLAADGSQVAYLNALIEEMNEGAIVLNENDAIVYANRRFAELVRLPLERVIDSRLQDLIQSRDHRAVTRLIQTGRSGSIRGEVMGRTGDGNGVPLRLSVSRISGGSNSMVSILVTDQTEARKHADELLQAQRDLESKIAERTADLVTSNRELRNARLAALNMMEDLVSFSDAVRQSNEELRNEIEQRRRAEEDVRRLNTELEERVRCRTVQLEHANRELEAFSYSVSHDLRAPLRALEGFSSLLIQSDDSTLSETARDYLERIRRAAQRMSDLTDDLLSLSRIGRNELRVRECDLAVIAREVAEDLRVAEPERDVELVIPDQMRAFGDVSLLRIVMQNLLGNAWKYTSTRESARIELGIERGSSGVTCFIRDNGVGFDPRHAENLFAPFQRLHSESEFKGTGIGLAIVQRVINRHGGVIRAESKPGWGTTFLFTLPEGPDE